MRQGSIWYDTSPVCEGRGTIPCNECSGTGHSDEIGHGPVGIRSHSGELARRALQRPMAAKTCTCPGCTCETCRGKGAISCTACRGHGMRGLPAYAGSYY
jgi:hypothetical protein